MAQTATIYNFDIDLADGDRGVYETLALRVARHPSESPEYLVARVLAYCLEYTEGIAFSKGLCEPDEAAINVRDLSGRIQSWIEIGTPDAARLHKASKASPRVAVYVHKEPTQFLRNLQGERIHNAEALEIYALDRSLVAALVERLDRRVAFALSVNDRELYLSIGDATLTGGIMRHPCPNSPAR
ncbi:MAG TPA: YaeQ family protein [Vicinamibacterales bacterium]